MALILYRPVYWVVTIFLGIGLFWLARRLHLRWWPAWVTRFLMVALAILGIFSPRGELARSEISSQHILILDQSDSIQPDNRAASLAQARGWVASQPNRALIVFGEQAVVVLNSQVAAPPVDGRASDLAAALDLASRMFIGSTGRLSLATDGNIQSVQPVSDSLSALKSKGIQVDIISMQERDTRGDVYLGQISVPRNLWEGTPFEILVPVFGQPSGQTVKLALKIDDRDSAIEPVLLSGNYYAYGIPSLAKGIVTFEITLDVEGDPYPENNRAYGVIQVFASPKVLFVTTEPDAAAGFATSLRQAGMDLKILTPNEMPLDPVVLQEYKVIFLHNLLAKELGQDRMLALQIFVTRLGGGLIMLGGRNSYTLGDYKNTLIEPMLPVKMEPPSRPSRSPVIFVLVIDRSGSMDELIGSVKPIQLAREAAMRSIENLKREDFLGVLTYSTGAYWDIPMRALGDGLSLRNALDAVSRVTTIGGTQIYNALTIALDSLKEFQDAKLETRHLLLLSDGLSADGSPEKFHALAQSALEQGVTISTIALGSKADTTLMADIAKTARGRFYAVEDPAELPGIMLSESEAARSENIQKGETALKLGEPGHPILSGLSTARLPGLVAYNALFSKREAGAEDVLISTNFDDPILSVWQYGLGRVAAWMGDIGEEWVGDWSTPQEQGLFWSQVVRYALPNPALGPAQVEVAIRDEQLSIDALIQDELDNPVNLSEVTFSYAIASGKVAQFRLKQTGPGHYTLEMPRPQPGAYRALLGYLPKNGGQISVPVPFVVNFPDEWRPASPGQGQANLNAWAGLVEAQEMGLADLLQPEESSAQGGLSVQTVDWWSYLLLTLVLLWPVEIAVRRRWLPWS